MDKENGWLITVPRLYGVEDLVRLQNEGLRYSMTGSEVGRSHHKVGEASQTYLQPQGSVALGSSPLDGLYFPLIFGLWIFPDRWCIRSLLRVRRGHTGYILGAFHRISVQKNIRKFSVSNAMGYRNFPTDHFTTTTADTSATTRKVSGS